MTRPLPQQTTTGTAWQLADEKIRDLQASIAAAERGEGSANIAVCRDMLDKWLEYRHNHGRTEPRAEL